MNKIYNRNGFTSSQLVKVLRAYPPDAIIVLSADEEGNDFGLLVSTEQDENGNIILWPASGTVEVES